MIRYKAWLYVIDRTHRIHFWHKNTSFYIDIVRSFSLRSILIYRDNMKKKTYIQNKQVQTNALSVALISFRPFRLYNYFFLLIVSLTHYYRLYPSLILFLSHHLNIFFHLSLSASHSLHSNIFSSLLASVQPFSRFSPSRLHLTSKFFDNGNYLNSIIVRRNDA